MAHASFYLFPTHAQDKKENNIAVTMMNASMHQELSRRRLRARFLPIVGREELRRFLRVPVAFPFPFQHGVVGVDEMSKALKDYHANPMKGYGCVPDASRQSSHLDATFTNAQKGPACGRQWNSNRHPVKCPTADAPAEQCSGVSTMTKSQPRTLEQ